MWEGKSISLNPEKELNWRAHDLKDKGASHGPRQDPTQGFNLLQMSPNWFLGIWTRSPIYSRPN